MVISNFSPKQDEIFGFISDKNRILICDGAVRSGKTVPMSIAFLTFAMSKFNNAKFAICSKTVQTAERNILDPLSSIDGLPWSLSFNKSSRVLTVFGNGSQNYFHIFGANDEKSASKVQGITLASVFFDEVALMPESFVNQAMARMLTDPSAKSWFNCNPEGPQHWFYKRFIEEKQADTKYLHFTMEDNPIMTDSAIKIAKSSFAGVFYKRYILGLWCLAEGCCYAVFSENKDKFYFDKIPELYRMQIYAGLDFGGNKSQHAVTITACDLEKKQIFILHSESFKAENVTPDQLYAKVNDIIADVEGFYGKKVSAIYADSAEQTLINGLKSRTSIPVRNSVKEPINDRIRATTSLMASGRLFLAKNRCRQLSDAFEAAVWNPKKLVDERLDDGTFNVDILDSFEYSFERNIRSLARKVAETNCWI